MLTWVHLPAGTSCDDTTLPCEVDVAKDDDGMIVGAVFRGEGGRWILMHKDACCESDARVLLVPAGASLGRAKMAWMAAYGPGRPLA